MSDELVIGDLLVRARDGDRGAWEQLVRRYTPLILIECRRHRLSGPDINDVVQSVWLRVVERLHSIRDPAALPRWIMTVARHECSRIMRQSDPHSDQRAEIEDFLTFAELEAGRTERHLAIWAAFQSLSPREQELLRLLVMEERPAREVSARLEIPMGSIGPTRARAVAKLRRLVNAATRVEAATPGRRQGSELAPHRSPPTGQVDEPPQPLQSHRVAPQRLLAVRAPAQVPLGEDLSVDVRIITEGRALPVDAAMAPLPSLVVTESGTPVTVTVHARDLHIQGPLQQTMLVMRAEDPAPVRFGFTAHRPGLHRIDVTAWAGGTFLAEVSVEVSVAAGGAVRDGRQRTAPMHTDRARPGEVTMEVRFDGVHYTFQLRSDIALFEPVIESVTNSPGVAVENVIKELQQLARGGLKNSPTMTRAMIRSAGIDLWSEMVPPDVRDQFWQVVSNMTAFTIATDYDVIPWELLYPLGTDDDAGFLVEQVPVVRRTYGQRRAPVISLRNTRFVVPPKAPTGARDEVAAICATLGVTDQELIGSADQLLTLINSGSLGATHFACHNTFSADGSFIEMDGGRFKPSLLAEATIRELLVQTAPLIFVNACRSAGAAPTYTKMLGWAQRFMSSGAGAFVGTLWAVRTDSSARFATAFYESLAHGATLGAAALAARTTRQDDPLDPTWLAYTVYGDPFAISG